MNARFSTAAGSDDFEMMSAIDAMYGRLGGTYFEILGVSRDCDAATLRRGYRQVCERFHPDLFLGVDLGARRPLLDVIFREATNAFMVLCRPDLRAEYERELAPAAEPYGVATPPTPAVIAPVAQSVIAFGDRPVENPGDRRPRGERDGGEQPIVAARADAGARRERLRAPPRGRAPRGRRAASSKLKRTPMAAMHSPLSSSVPRAEVPPPPQRHPLGGGAPRRERGPRRRPWSGPPRGPASA